VVCRSVCLSVCRSVTKLSPAKTAQPIEMPFGLKTRVGLRNHVLDGGFRYPMGRDSFKGFVVMYSNTAVSCAKMAEPIDMLFGLWTRVGPGKHVLRWGTHWRHMANTTEPSVCGGDASFCQIALITCIECIV